MKNFVTKILILIVYWISICNVYSMNLHKQLHSGVVIIDKDSVELGLEAIKKIDKQTESLIIVVKGNESRSWTVYPPNATGRLYLTSQYDYPTKLSQLPNEIESLEVLNYLDVSFLGIQKLPKFDKLDNIKFLDISHNPIDIGREIPNILKISSLKVLNIQGCDFSEEDISSILISRPDITILSMVGQSKLEYFKRKPIFPDEKEAKIIEFLRIVHTYYPIGIPYLNELFLSDQKKKYLSSDSLWNRFVSTVKEKTEIPGIIAVDSNNLPSKYIIIPLGKTNSNEIQVQEVKTAVCNISSLTNHYVIYFETQYIFEKYKNRNRPLVKNIVYGKGLCSTSEVELLNKLKAIINLYYPDYHFTDHQLLMTTYIQGGSPHWENTDNKSKFPIYSFLFGPYNFENAEILK